MTIGCLQMRRLRHSQVRCASSTSCSTCRKKRNWWTVSRKDICLSNFPFLWSIYVCISWIAFQSHACGHQKLGVLHDQPPLWRFYQRNTFTILKLRRNFMRHPVDIKHCYAPINVYLGIYDIVCSYMYVIMFKTTRAATSQCFRLLVQLLEEPSAASRLDVL